MSADKREVIRVSEVMRTQFDTVDGLDTVETALKTMKHVETKCLVVNKRHDDDEFGLLLISDIARSVLAKNKAPDRVNVYEIMAKPVISVSPEMDVRYCARLFDRFDISRAPVIKGGNVVGVVSLTDLVLKSLGVVVK